MYYDRLDESNTTTTLCNPCPYEYDCERCKKEMEESVNGATVTLSYASSVDYVLVELWISKNKTVIAPASVVLADDGSYEIQFIGNTIRLSEDTYGKRWRCWELREPHKIDRDRIPWE